MLLVGGLPWLGLCFEFPAWNLSVEIPLDQSSAFTFSALTLLVG